MKCPGCEEVELPEGHESFEVNQTRYFSCPAIQSGVHSVTQHPVHHDMIRYWVLVSPEFYRERESPDGAS